MKFSHPAYAIVGRGRWAKVMSNVLSGEQRHVVMMEEMRRRLGEDDASYRARLTVALAAAGAEIVWLCIPPGPDLPLIMEAAIRAGLSVVVEKPWLCPVAQTTNLIELVRSRNALIGVHHQYCLLEGVEEWRFRFQNAANLAFGGRFTLSRSGRLGISAIENLGSHLLAIREYAVPQSAFLEIECAYETADERRVWIQPEGNATSSIDFSSNKEPLIQRFIAKFEEALAAKAEFPFDLEFAMRVYDGLKRLKRNQPA
jgi:hypothetical protein